MQSMMKQFHRDYVYRVRSDRFSPCVTAAPHRHRTSDHVQSFDHEGLQPFLAMIVQLHAC